MDFATRWLSVAVFALLLPFAAFGQAAEDRPVAVPVDPGKIDMEQVREELGVNDFTAPSIEHLLAELMDLRPIPIEKTWKDVKADAPQDRAVLALSAGRGCARASGGAGSGASPASSPRSRPGRWRPRAPRG